MLSYWFSAPLSYWWPLLFTVGFAVVGVIAVYTTLARRKEEPDATRIATLYGIGFGLAALTELMMFLDVAFKWSLAALFSMTATSVTILAVAAVAVALIALGIALLLQYREERSYRAAHGYAR